MRCYKRKSVFDAVNERIDFIFSKFKKVVVSVSGGKDSTLVFELMWKRALELGRELNVFFLDQEAEYAATIDIIQGIVHRKNVVPYWYQVPFYLTSVTSSKQDFFYAWDPAAESQWIHPKDPIAIKEIKGDYPHRFYPFIDWFEKQWGADTCFVLGFRAEESMNRYRAVIKTPAFEDVRWATKSNGILKFYPIYDWSFDDVFLYFYQNKTHYNKVYDYMHIKDPAETVRKMRVSNLIHEKAYKCLVNLQEFEHDTYERLCARLSGVRTTALYGEEATMYNARTLPEKFKTWIEYRDYLVNTTPFDMKEVFTDRFARQPDTERYHRHQVKQLLLNDWENSLPISASKEEREKDYEDPLKKWWDIL
jgi:predicted phosphoadenosine phosphosulfate sulfurtransferase